MCLLVCWWCSPYVHNMLFAGVRTAAAAPAAAAAHPRHAWLLFVGDCSKFFPWLLVLVLVLARALLPCLVLVPALCSTCFRAAIVCLILVLACACALLNSWCWCFSLAPWLLFLRWGSHCSPLACYCGSRCDQLACCWGLLTLWFTCLLLEPVLRSVCLLMKLVLSSTCWYPSEVTHITIFY